MKEPTFGDKIRVTTGKEVYEGVLIPSPELTAEETLLLKLDSGYNIGFKKEDVKGVKVLREKTPEKQSPPETGEKDPSLPDVSILSTGGTISSRIDYTTGGVAASLTAGQLLESMPKLKGDVNLQTRSIMNVMSEDMNPSLWMEMAKEVAKEINQGADGVVLTHGTDTMHYSSAALSFLLRDTSKPIVFTGAQRSIDRGSSDAFLNLACAINMAKTDYPGVCLVMHEDMSDNRCLAHFGTRARKMHTSKRDAFKSINSPPLARITSDGDVDFLQDYARSHEKHEIRLDGGFNEKVGFIKTYPGMSPDLLDFYIDKGYDGIVFEGTALGHLPVSRDGYSLLPAIERALEEDMVLAMTTQSLYGRVHPHVYSNLRKLSTRGVIYCGDMLPGVGYVKMMWVLDKTGSLSEARNLLTKPLANELSKSSIIT